MPFQSFEEELATRGFSWDRFREIFPFGSTEYGEGRYQRLVTQVLEQLPDDRQRETLLSLLDVQAAAFLEQVWVQNQFFDVAEEIRLAKERAECTPKFSEFRYCSDASQRRDPPHLMAAEYAATWLQINDNLRVRFRLRGQSLRVAMMRLGDGEFLASRISGETTNERL